MHEYFTWFAPTGVPYYPQTGNGTIEFEEFVAMMSRKLREPDTDEDVRGAFRVYDQNSKGSITAEDLEKAMGDLRTDLNPEEIAEMIRETDTDGDGQVSLDGTSRHLFRH